MVRVLKLLSIAAWLAWASSWAMTQASWVGSSVAGQGAGLAAVAWQSAAVVVRRVIAIGVAMRLTCINRSRMRYGG
jgi:hypothetical protein